MRYELYGVLSTNGKLSVDRVTMTDGHNVFISSSNSMKKAFDTLGDLNENIYPLFIILEKQRKCSAPISCESGRTIERCSL